MTPTAVAIYSPVRPIDRLSSRITKRTVDVLGALVGLVISVPIAAIIGPIVLWQSRGIFFHRQERVGKDGRDFVILKIQSMVPDAEKSGPQWAQENDSRCLPIGHFIRRWNIDEIPQFWNVLMGDMSLVGPRPERAFYVSRLSKEIPNYNARHSSLPGMSGWAQVNGWRGNTCKTTRTDFDLWYIENWSLTLDLQIILKTFTAYKNAC